MSNKSPINRPSHLPDFKFPPLSEVVLGVQFTALQDYQQIRSGEVWHLFKDKYPEVQEHPPLPPSFETFGQPFNHSFVPQFGFINGVVNNRFWFLREGGTELIQFQNNRLIHNWRKGSDPAKGYPRFEAMESSLRKELQTLEQYANTLKPQIIQINQCEVSYINHIKFDRKNGENISDWLDFINFKSSSPSDLNIAFRDVLKNKQGEPVGRFYVESSLGYLPNEFEVIVLSLSVKGPPLGGTDIDSALNFLSFGRDEIVKRFAELTTDYAHKKWGRIN